MKYLELNIKLSDADEIALRNIYTQEEVEQAVKSYLKEMIALSSPTTQKKLIQESRKVFNELKKIRLDNNE